MDTATASSVGNAAVSVWYSYFVPRIAVLCDQYH